MSLMKLTNFPISTVSEYRSVYQIDMVSGVFRTLSNKELFAKISNS